MNNTAEWFAVVAVLELPVSEDIGPETDYPG
jgi:hypothetical protein